MAKRLKKANLNTVLGAGNKKQGMLFEDAFTDLQQEVLTAADGTRTVNGIAVFLAKPKEKILQITRRFLHDGYLKVLEPETVLNNCKEVIAQGRLEDGIGLYLFVLDCQPDNYSAMSELAELYTRAAYAREAAELYSALADQYIDQSRLGEALVAFRKASGLQAGNFNIQDGLAKLCVSTGRVEEAARVWRAYAMRLARAGEFKDALNIIDNAVSLVGGNDTLLYAEAEILALMEGKSREEKIMNFESSNDLEVIQKDLTNEGSVVQDETILTVGVSDNRVINSNVEEFNAIENIDSNEVYSENSECFASESERSYSEIRVREYDRSESDVVKSARGGRWILLALLILVFALFILAGINYSYRAKMYSAVLESAGIGSLVQQAELLEKIEISEAALKVLDENMPPFAFMQSSEYKNQRARIEQLVRDMNSELMSNNVVFEKLVGEWEIHHNEVLANKIFQLRKSESISKEKQVQADEIYKNWVKEKEQKSRELKDYIEVLADKTLDSKLRFSAYQNLLLNFPYVFEKAYPKGVKGLSVPSRINAEIADTGIAVDLTLTGAEKREDGYWEIPVDSSSNVFIEHHGYRLGDELNYEKTKMPYPLTFDQLFVLKKVPVLDYKLDMGFSPELGAVLGKTGKILFTNREEYLISDTLKAGSVSKGSYTKGFEENVNKSVGLNVFSLGRWVGVLSDGVVYTGNLESLSSGINNIRNANLGDVYFADMVDLELGSYDGVGVLVTSFFATEKDKRDPVQILGVENGKKIWGNTAFVKSLYKTITSPIVYAEKVSWYYLFASSTGKILLVMENGDIFKEFDIKLKNGAELHKDSVKIFKPGSDYVLFADDKVYRLDLNSEPNLIPLWTVNDEGKKVLPSASGVLEYGGGVLSVYSLSNGVKQFDYNYSGKIMLQPVVVDGVIYVVVGDVDWSNAELVALDTNKKSKPILWKYSLNTEIKLVFGSEDKVYLLTEGGRVLGFGN